jgi:hypothetical protein
VKAQERIYHLSKGIESLTIEEHGRFFDIVQRLGLSNELKQAAIALYLDFKSRPAGEYNEDHKNLDIFLIASVSLAAKAIGELRTDQEFESKLFGTSEKLVDAEERMLRSFGVRDNAMPFLEFVSQLTRRQIESMADSFAERGLIDVSERDELVQRAYDYLDAAVEKGLSPKMSYRGRAAGVMLKAITDLALEIPDLEIARAAGLGKKSMRINKGVIEALLHD